MTISTLLAPLPSPGWLHESTRESEIRDPDLGSGIEL